MNTLIVKPYNYCELSGLAKEFLKLPEKVVAKKVAPKYEYLGAGANLPALPQKIETENAYFSPSSIIDQNDAEVAKIFHILV